MAQDLAQAVPEGLRYLPDVLSAAEEQELVEQIGTLTFSDVRMHGVVAKRRVSHFGWRYGYETWITPGPPMPEFLLPFRSRIAELVRVEPDAFVEALVTEYPAGAGIGRHRDAPMFGPLVVGISLLGTCRLRFQRGKGSARETFALVLEPRSVYVLSGPARIFSPAHPRRAKTRPFPIAAQHSGYACAPLFDYVSNGHGGLKKEAYGA